MDEAAYEERIRQDVAERGWHVCIIAQDDEGPAFAYTVGLHESFQHPELIIFGLDRGEAGGTMHKILNDIGDLIARGKSFENGSESNEVLTGYSCAFQAVEKKYFRDHFGYAIWFYDGESFPVNQVLWPDKLGHFPGQQSFAENLIWFQPLLSATE